jgi:hypothetical protein
MREELDKKLVADFPYIFCDRNKGMDESCMYWGFSVGDGWYDIIQNICEELMSIHKETGVQMVAQQVKEKFGSLRFYAAYNDHLLPCNRSEIVEAIDRAHSIINMLCDKSSSVCETCGEDGKQQTDGWIKTLCDTCQDIKNKKEQKTWF